MELLYHLHVLVSDLHLWQVDLFCRRADQDVLQGGCLWVRLAVAALHHQLQLIYLALALSGSYLEFSVSFLQGFVLVLDAPGDFPILGHLLLQLLVLLLEVVDPLVLHLVLLAIVQDV